LSITRALNKGVRYIRKWKSALLPPLKQIDLFPSDVIVHFSHHKCLTAYYATILSRLGEEFSFEMKGFRSDLDEFEKAVLSNSGKRIVSLNNRSDITFEKFPLYRGSHFTRDPRDLIVSGYRYHLWTKEAWCISPDFQWGEITNLPAFKEYIEENPRYFPQHISYQDYLNRLDPERGLILELLWRQGMLENMEKWNYHNDQIIEMRYENIIGNESDCFYRIFSHYEFHPKLIERGVEIAEQFSMKNVKKSDFGHVRKGTPRQWKSEFSPTVKRLFKELNGDLIISLDYEKDMNW
jgi:hypothetical protein